MHLSSFSHPCSIRREASQQSAAIHRWVFRLEQALVLAIVLDTWRTALVVRLAIAGQTCYINHTYTCVIDVHMYHYRASIMGAVPL